MRARAANERIGSHAAVQAAQGGYALPAPGHASIAQGLGINDDPGLEREADRVARAVVRRSSEPGREVHHAGTGSAPIGPATASAIEAARGRGAPLEETVRSSMEGAFGADFGGVRVHTDAHASKLSRALSARAFTTGRDIFFSAGHWAPHTAAGQSLLAHELTHVLQQQQGTPSVQRAIGVEFECSNLAITDAPGGTAKNTEITGGSSWKMVYEKTSAGSAVAEFKTEPPAETKKSFLRGVEHMMKQATELGEAVDGKTRIGGFEITKEGPGAVEGAPQVTMGIPLGNLPKAYGLFGELSDSVSYRKYLELQSEKDPDGKPVKDLPPETRGFILLCIDYIQRGHIPKEKRTKGVDIPPEKGDYVDDVSYAEAVKKFEEGGRVFAKGLFDMMVRTDFSNIFKTLPKDQQDNLTTELPKSKKLAIKKKWRRWLVANATRPWSSELRKFSGMHGEEEVKTLMEEKIVTQKIQGWKEPGGGPTRGRWLKAMPRKDLMAGEFMGIGGLGDKTDVLESDGTTKVPIFEMRTPENASIPVGKWKDKAEEWWNMYMTVVNNQRINRGPKDVT